ncbi:MAG: tRNA uridine-5-carboxymethylaminomethyl(34) synthesis GTPase MnmE [Chitinispirillales bacterium]|jgi:tRNA modification GTPase|nr:tRNA uridine-5-carboxymethylaminomethyl(34) synthesis GTPase MnmE [Chitinispirillales bacterium]
MNISTSTIAALSTPTGRGALAVIRITGDDAHEIFAETIREKEKFQKEENRKIGIYTVEFGDGVAFVSESESNSGSAALLPEVAEAAELVEAVEDSNNLQNKSNSVPKIKIIDEVTAIKYSAPKSFTGENMVEILCHGGTIITAKILDSLFRAGAHPAGRGEFSKRALLNGKMDLLKAESIASLIDSQTEKHHESAVTAYQGNQRSKIEKYKLRVVDLLSDIESHIEFGEEDDVAGSQLNTRKKLETIALELEEELRRSERIKGFDEGLFLALAGPPNAGKSSLFNEILGFDRSIVHDRAGTTRDVVSEKISLDGITVKLFDCAGIRETQDSVEQKGIERTLSAVKDAHFILWVTSADEHIDTDEKKEILENKEKILVVINKIDTITNNDSPVNQKTQFCETNRLNYVEISVKEKINVEKLFTQTGRAIREITEKTAPPEIIVNDRHRGIINSVLNELRQTIFNIDREEIAAQYLRNALNLLSEFSGHVTSDEVMNNIFDKFCIGK